MTLGEKLKELRKEKGLSLRELAKQIGNISASYLSDIENDRYDPSLKKLKSIAQALNVPTAYLLDIYDQSHSGYEKFKLERKKIKYETVEIVNVPILGEIAAGEPVIAEENILGYEKIPADDIRGGEYFILRVSGDSMINAGIYEGDHVLIKKQPTCETGDIAAVIVNAENATLKRVYFSNGKLLLQPENPKYKPIMVDEDDVRIVGKAVKVIHKL